MKRFSYMIKTKPGYRSLEVSESRGLVTRTQSSAEEASDVRSALSVELRREPHRRLAAHRADPTSSIPWDEFRAKRLKIQP